VGNFQAIIKSKLWTFCSKVSSLFGFITSTIFISRISWIVGFVGCETCVMCFWWLDFPCGGLHCGENLYSCTTFSLYGCMWSWLHLVTTMNLQLSTWGPTIHGLVLQNNFLVMNIPCEIVTYTWRMSSF
jgi:hypothetical protein